VLCSVFHYKLLTVTTIASAVRSMIPLGINGIIIACALSLLTTAYMVIA
jgi:hypothetical protein